ncbi:hypothetical protein BS78_01G373400 [Paspalum vaginatum]|nr:hypothetical protein BS78_01G373400 [Paspalum vaginatum]
MFRCFAFVLHCARIEGSRLLHLMSFNGSFSVHRDCLARSG